MKTQLVKISEIQENADNPRVVNDEHFKKLVKSIKEFPKMLSIRPLVVDNAMRVLGGNMRLRACKKLGIKEVPVIFAKDLTPDEQKEFIIKDNLGYGEWDFVKLHEEWDVQELEDWGLELPGVDMDTDDLDDNFSLKNGDKSNLQQITLTLSDEQIEELKTALDEIRHSDEFKYVETYGNVNTNGNALYLLVMQWRKGT